MKKNYWSITAEHPIFTCTINDEDYDIDVYINLIKKVIDSGRKYEIFKILDNTGTKDVGDEYIEMWLDFMRKKEISNSNFKERIKGDAFVTACHFPYVNKMIDYNACAKMAYYGFKGEIKFDTIFTNEVFYPLLNQERVHLYHYSETICYTPLEVRLELRYRKHLTLTIDTGLGIWFPYFKPDYDMDKQRLEDFPLNENGYIDNRELYLLNTPRLIGFIKELRTFFKKNKGKDITNCSKLEKMPIFPWYDI